MKRGKGITINLSNKVFYTLIALIFLIVAGGIVFAYNSNPADPAVFGHSAEEIEGLEDVGGDLEQQIVCSDNKTVSCPMGWTRSGCSVSYIRNTDKNLYSKPEGDSSCIENGAGVGSICVHCMKLK